MAKIAIFNHGKESSPRSPKIVALSKITDRYGYDKLSIDYTNQMDPDERVKQLLAVDLSGYDQVLLVGSSMGAYVATVAAEQIKPQALFLMAPAFYLPGYARNEFYFDNNNVHVIHGWSDEIVPPEHAWRFCRQYKVPLTMIEADHVFSATLPALERQFNSFLHELLSA